MMSIRDCLECRCFRDCPEAPARYLEAVRQETWQTDQNSTLCAGLEYHRPLQMRRAIAACLHHCPQITARGYCNLLDAFARGLMLADSPHRDALAQPARACEVSQRLAPYAPWELNEALQICDTCALRRYCITFAMLWHQQWAGRAVPPNSPTGCNYSHPARLAAATWQELAVALAGCYASCGFTRSCYWEMTVMLVAASKYRPGEPPSFKPASTVPPVPPDSPDQIAPCRTIDRCRLCRQLRNCPDVLTIYAQTIQPAGPLEAAGCYQTGYTPMLPRRRAIASCIRHCGNPAVCSLFGTAVRVTILVGDADRLPPPPPHQLAPCCNTLQPGQLAGALRGCIERCNAASHCSALARVWRQWAEQEAQPSDATGCNYSDPMLLLGTHWQELASALAGCRLSCSNARYCSWARVVAFVGANKYARQPRPLPQHPKPRPDSQVVTFPGGPIPDATIQLGTDPEFELISRRTNTIVQADTVISGGTCAQVGTDGAGIQVELRPNPGTPAQLVENLRGLFREFYCQYGSRYYLAYTGNTYPLGAHIHASVWRDGSLLQLQPDQQAAIAHALDLVLGPLVCWSGRARGRYARRGAWRPQPHGVEYRTLPACIFSTPTLARAVLEIAAAIITRLVTTGKFQPASFNPTECLPQATIAEWSGFVEYGPTAPADVLSSWGISN